jgi:nucleotidyltransferase/DNA polymerase involved in DNA repair
MVCFSLLLVPVGVLLFVQDLPLGKVKGLGGKLGSRLEQLGCRTAGAAAAVPWEQLLTCFDAKAR